MYADTDFFAALFKKQDWLKANAESILARYRNSIEASESTFVELMYLSKKFNLDPVELATDVMSLCSITNGTYLKAAIFVKRGVGVLDAFHAAHAGDGIISSDSVFDEIGINRVRLEGRA